MSTGKSFQPVGRTERIHLLDVLRGFALGGIIFVNIQVISGLSFRPFSTFFDLHARIRHPRIALQTEAKVPEWYGGQ